MAIAGLLGTETALALIPPLGWTLAVLSGWDIGAIVFLVLAWWLIGRCDGQLTGQTAARDNESGRTAAVLVMGASVASLAAVAFTPAHRWAPARRPAAGAHRRRLGDGRAVMAGGGARE